MDQPDKNGEIMSLNVLIAYGSRFGCTEEVSQKIAEILQKEGISTQVLNLRKTKKREWPSPTEFDGVLIGSGIKIAKWTKEPKTYLEKFGEVINKRENVLGLFVCCATAATDKEHAREEYLEKVMEKAGITADIYDAFGGVLDMTESSRMGFLDKRMLKMASKGTQEEQGFELDENGKNDLRDWDQIQEFAGKFAALVKG